MQIDAEKRGFTNGYTNHGPGTQLPSSWALNRFRCTRTGYCLPQPSTSFGVSLHHLKDIALLDMAQLLRTATSRARLEGICLVAFDRTTNGGRATVEIVSQDMAGHTGQSRSDDRYTLFF